MNRYIPNQHGAWAMLVVPFLCGLSLSGGSWLHVPLFLCWLVMYLFSFPLLLWIKTGRAARYRQPTLLYGVLLVPLLTTIVWMEPQLLWYSVILLLFFIPNMYFARKRKERALLNDVLAIVLFCSFVYPAAFVGEDMNWATASHLFLILVMYFCGTAVYVKTMIREKNNRIYYRISVCYHLLLLLMAGWWNVWLMIPAAILLLRSIWLPHLPLNIKTVGMIEILGAMLVCVSLIGFNN
ncbi:YwiC-like family protein [Paenibacillus sp. WLX2291]|uniref:YwiC-like family protein n=1 Tax=Paenibacillus sp. WLX2291 TaxID=3296934 RepID=UPI003983E0CA